jgi:colicin import membrane protein
MAVTKEQIFDAADQIAANGQRPTLEAIRQIVGGSYTTISPALNEWKSRQKASVGPLREPAPQAVGDRLAEFGTDIWALALELANARLASEREALEQVRADMEGAQAEAAELADRLAGEVEDLQTRCAELTDRVVADEKEARELRDQLATAQEKARTAETRTVEIERRAADLKGALLAAQEQIKSAAAELEIERTRHQQEVERLREKLDEQKKANQAITTELMKIQAKFDATDQAHQEQRKQAAAEIQRAAERLTVTQAERDDARKAVSIAREEAARLAGQLTAHQEQTTAFLARLAPAAQSDHGDGAMVPKDKTTTKKKGA